MNELNQLNNVNSYCNGYFRMRKICDKCSEVKSIVCVFRFYNGEDKIRS